MGFRVESERASFQSLTPSKNISAPPRLTTLSRYAVVVTGRVAASGLHSVCRALRLRRQAGGARGERGAWSRRGAHHGQRSIHLVQAPHTGRAPPLIRPPPTCSPPRGRPTRTSFVAASSLALGCLPRPGRRWRAEDEDARRRRRRRRQVPKHQNHPRAQACHAHACGASDVLCSATLSVRRGSEQKPAQGVSAVSALEPT